MPCTLRDSPISPEPARRRRLGIRARALVAACSLMALLSLSGLVSSSFTATTGTAANRLAAAAVFVPVNVTAPSITDPGTGAISAERGEWRRHVDAYTYVWERLGEDGFQPIDNATGSSYSPTPEDGVRSIRVTVTAHNAAGSTTATSEPVTVQRGEKPERLTLPTITGDAVENATLTASDGTWDNDPETFTYRWLRCDTDGAFCDPVAGATDRTYTLVEGDVGHRFRVEVTAANAYGEQAAMSAATAAVLPRSAPISQTAPSISGSTVRGNALTATAGTWDPSAGATYSYQWLRCTSTDPASCSTIAGATDSTYTTVLDDIGLRIRVRVTATNAAGANSRTSSYTALITGATPEERYLHRVEADGPVALHTFNANNTQDSINTSRNAGTNVTTNQAGALSGGRSVALNGSGQYLSLGWSPTCNASALTVEMWAYWTSNRNYERLFDFGNVGGGSYLALTPRFGAAGQMWGMVWVNGAWWDLTGAAPLPTGAWKHVTMTYTTGRTVTIYVDGVAVSSGTSPWTVGQIGCHPNNWFGRSLWAADPYFGGRMDNIAIFHKALSAAQVKAHYDARL